MAKRNLRDAHHFLSWDYATPYGLNIVREAVLMGELDVNFQGKGKIFAITPLVLAAYLGDDDCVSEFIKIGANVHHQGLTKKKLTALDYAVKRGHFKVAKILLNNGANVNLATNPDILITAGRNNGLELVKLLITNIKTQLNLTIDWLNHEDKEQTTLLAYAAAQGNKDLVEYLLDLGADRNTASNKENLPIVLAILNNKPDVVKLLIPAEGIDLNQKITQDQTIFSYCIQNSSPECLKVLLDNNLNTIDIDILNSGLSITFANQSIDFTDRKLEFIIQLIEHGADPNTLGQPLLQKAIEEENLNLVRLLMKNQNYIDNNSKTIINSNTSNQELINISIQHGFTINIHEENDSSNLTQAILSYEEIIATQSNNSDHKLQEFLMRIYGAPPDHSWQQIKLLMNELCVQLRDQKIITGNTYTNFNKACALLINNHHPMILNTKTMLENITFLLVADDSTPKDLKQQVIIDLISPFSFCKEGAQGEIQSKYVFLKSGTLGEQLRAFAKDVIERIALKLYTGIHARNTLLYIAYKAGVKILGETQKDPYSGGVTQTYALPQIKSALNKDYTIENFVDSTIATIRSNLSVTKLILSNTKEYKSKILKVLAVLDISAEDLNVVFISKLNIPHLVLSEIIDAAVLRNLDDYKFITSPPSPAELANMKNQEFYILHKDQEISFVWKGKIYPIANINSLPNLYKQLLEFDKNPPITTLDDIFNKHEVGAKSEIGSPYLEINKVFLEYKVFAKLEADKLLRANDPGKNISDVLKQRLPIYHAKKVFIVPNVEKIVFATSKGEKVFYTRANKLISEYEIINDPSIQNELANKISKYNNSELMQYLNSLSLNKKLFSMIIKLYLLAANLEKTTELINYSFEQKNISFELLSAIITARPAEFITWISNSANRDKSELLLAELLKPNALIFAMQFYSNPEVKKFIAGNSPIATEFAKNFHLFISTLPAHIAIQVLAYNNMNEKFLSLINQECQKIITDNSVQQEAKSALLVKFIIDLAQASPKAFSLWLADPGSQTIIENVLQLLLKAGSKFDVLKNLYANDAFKRAVAKNLSASTSIFPQVKQAQGLNSAIAAELHRFILQDNSGDKINIDYNAFILQTFLSRGESKKTKTPSLSRLVRAELNKLLPNHVQSFAQWINNNPKDAIDLYARIMPYVNNTFFKEFSLLMIKYMYAPNAPQSDEHRELVANFERKLSSLKGRSHIANARFNQYPTNENFTKLIEKGLPFEKETSIYLYNSDFISKWQGKQDQFLKSIYASKNVNGFKVALVWFLQLSQQNNTATPLIESKLQTYLKNTMRFRLGGDVRFLNSVYEKVSTAQIEMILDNKFKFSHILTKKPARKIKLLVLAMEKDPKKGAADGKDFITSWLEKNHEKFSIYNILNLTTLAEKESADGKEIDYYPIINFVFNNFSKYTPEKRIAFIQWCTAHNDQEFLAKVVKNKANITAIIDTLKAVQKPKAVKIFGVTIHAYSNTKLTTLIKFYESHLTTASTQEETIPTAPVAEQPQEPIEPLTTDSISLISAALKVEIDSNNSISKKSQHARIRAAVIQSFSEYYPETAPLSLSAIEDALYNFANITAQVLISSNDDSQILFNNVKEQKINLVDLFRVILATITKNQPTPSQLTEASTLTEIASELNDKAGLIEGYQFQEEPKKIPKETPKEETPKKETPKIDVDPLPVTSINQKVQVQDSAAANNSVVSKNNGVGASGQRQAGQVNVTPVSERIPAETGPTSITPKPNNAATTTPSRITIPPAFSSAAGNVPPQSITMTTIYKGKKEKPDPNPSIASLMAAFEPPQKQNGAKPQPHAKVQVQKVSDPKAGGPGSTGGKTH